MRWWGTASVVSKIPGEVEELLRQARCKDWRQLLKRAIHRLDPSIDSILSSIPSLSDDEFIPFLDTFTLRPALHAFISPT
jgi:hypothetical protein